MKTNAKKVKVALITGANRGLGLETARQLGGTGVHLVLGVRDLKRAASAIKLLKKEGIDAEAIRLDVASPATHARAFDYLKRHFGKLDILVNNAGIKLEGVTSLKKGPRPDHTSGLKMEVLRRTFDVNFFGTVALTQKLLPLIRKSPAGRIVNVSSILGSLGAHTDPKSPVYTRKSFAYDASKTALNAFTVHLAYELKDTKIKVNSAHPGWVRTAMGGPEADLDITEGVKTSVRLATLPDDGPTGGYFHLDKRLPW
jgi:NAD(P)-dependent dehydrogenase (short-subunit alcohol dehydrogenase family)